MAAYQRAALGNKAVVLAGKTGGPSLEPDYSALLVNRMARLVLFDLDSIVESKY